MGTANSDAAFRRDNSGPTTRINPGRPEPASLPELGKNTRMASKEHASSTAPYRDLSETERDCLKLVAEGKKNAEISISLNMAEPEVNAALADAQKKLGANNRLHAVSLALLRGVIR
jgi:DNA-binding CsgD family transcriptional regulator